MAVTGAYFAFDYPPGPVFIALLVALFTTVTAGHRRAALIVAGIGYAFFVIGDLTVDRASAEHSLVGYVGAAAWLLLMLAIAEAVRAGRERAREVAHALEEEERRRASEERMRIAHDLHDVVAHNISLINVQAGVALHLIDEQPDQARTALAAIKEASRDALRELRSTLDILRGADDGAPRSPAPGLADLPDLVDSARTGGLDARLEVDGDARQLPAAVELAAYRVVQEALTNVRRHAGATTATVRVSYRAADLAIQVDDDGKGGAPGPAARATRSDDWPAPGEHQEGFGIRGMRERVAGLGGALSARPRPGGGFRVRAHIPTAGGPRGVVPPAGADSGEAAAAPGSSPGPAPHSPAGAATTAAGAASSGEQEQDDVAPPGGDTG
jgi:signal transduction histidine kinase